MTKQQLLALRCADVIHAVIPNGWFAYTREDVAVGVLLDGTIAVYNHFDGYCEWNVDGSARAGRSSTSSTEFQELEREVDLTATELAVLPGALAGLEEVR